MMCLAPRIRSPTLVRRLAAYATRDHILPIPSSRCFSSSSNDDRQILLRHETHPDIPGAEVSTLTLNRPKANAMGSQMLQQLQDSLSELEQDACASRCLVLLSSSPKVFSAGADLKERATMSMDQAQAFVTELRNTMDRVSCLPMPVLVAMEGVALGGGLELALAADIILASRTATLGLPETTLAIVPGAGGTQRLPRRIGVARAKELIFTGRRLNGVEAAEYGLVQHVVEPGQVQAHAMDMAWRIAQNGPVAIRAAKAAMDQGLMAPTMTEALEVERQAYAKVIPTSDRSEGLAAFKDGRKPVYKGQ